MSLLGCSTPVQPLRSQNAWLSRYSFCRPCLRTRLLKHSPPGVQLSSTVFPRLSAFEASQIGQNSKATLLGFLAPSAYSETRVHGLTVLPVTQRHRQAPRTFGKSATSTDSLSARESASSPNLLATEPLPGFLNLSAAFFLSPPSHHFQMGNARGVTPSRGLHLSRSPDNSSLSEYPPDVHPSGCATSCLGRGAVGHTGCT
jgi:hypothetical protein